MRARERAHAQSQAWVSSGAFHLVVQEMNVIEASKREQASRRKQLTVAARTGVSHGFRGSREGERRTSSIYYSQGTESRRDPAGGDGGGAEHECELGECVMYSDFLHAILLTRHAYS